LTGLKSTSKIFIFIHFFYVFVSFARPVSRKSKEHNGTEMFMLYASLGRS